jgi:hypothetical protein
MRECLVVYENYRCCYVLNGIGGSAFIIVIKYTYQKRVQKDEIKCQDNNHE